jgi:hypothetical protein
MLKAHHNSNTIVCLISVKSQEDLSWQKSAWKHGPPENGCGAVHWEGQKKARSGTAAPCLEKYVYFRSEI